MANDVKVDAAQLIALASFLQVVTSPNTPTMGPWLSQLHNRTATAESADNQVRHDLGLPPSTSFP